MIWLAQQHVGDVTQMLWMKIVPKHSTQLGIRFTFHNHRNWNFFGLRQSNFSKVTHVTKVPPTSAFLLPLEMLVSRAAIGPHRCNGSVTIYYTDWEPTHTVATHNWNQILVLLINSGKHATLMMRKINKELVGRMWVTVPWGRHLGDIEIVIASPFRGSATSSSQSFSCAPGALQPSRHFYGCSETAKFSFTVYAAPTPRASLQGNVRSFHKLQRCN